MEIQELRIKEELGLKHVLADLRKKLEELNFSDRQKQLKNIREIRQIKKDVARVLMALKEKNSKK
ncbi:MAG: 50S ribosomal protein L29 [Patescibacteria group bacterium]